MRPKGKVVYRSPENPAAKEAHEFLVAEENRLREQREKRAAQRAARGVPNYLCYPDAFKDHYDPETKIWTGGKLPCCFKCKGTLYPEENHKCPGYMPDTMRLNTNLTLEQRKAIRRAAWLEGDGDWDDDQYDPTTPEPDWSNMMHEAETGETYDQVVIDGMTEEEWMERRRQQLGHAPDYDPYFESDDFEDGGYEEE